MPIYITTTDITNRISTQVYNDVFDDDADGTADAAIVTAFADEAESVVEQTIAKTYGQAGLATVRALATTVPVGMKRLILDVFEVRMGRRHPEYIRGEWQQRHEDVKADLQELRLRDVQLDVIGVIEPAVTDGGEVRSGDPDDTDGDPEPAVYINGLGIF